jgi:dephospho-CoA kinase
MLIGVVGLNCAGKDTFANYLAQKYNFVHKSLSDAIREEARKRNLDPSNREVLIPLGNELREKGGAGILAEMLLENYTPTQNLVLSSVRNPMEIEKIKGKGGMIVEVFAPIKYRYERNLERIAKQGRGEFTFEDFVEKEKIELESTDPTKQQNLKCIKMADAKIENTGNINEFEKKIDEFMKKQNKK